MAITAGYASRVSAVELHVTAAVPGIQTAAVCPHTTPAVTRTKNPAGLSAGNALNSAGRKRGPYYRGQRCKV